MGFDTALGSVIGSAHRRAGRNGQDAGVIARRDDTLVAVVTDGCGSARHSEVGAKLGAQIVAREVLARCASPFDWTAIAASVAEQLSHVASPFSADCATLADTFLFTILGAVMTPHETVIFSAGDGIFAVNGTTQQIGPFPGNAPPYLGYALLGASSPAFTVQYEGATTDIDTLLIATDGAEPLMNAHTAPFWTDDAIFSNPDALRRRLFLLTRPGSALLDDDTTIAVIRRAA
jgi:hypothetical protein